MSGRDQAVDRRGDALRGQMVRGMPGHARSARAGRPVGLHCRFPRTAAPHCRRRDAAIGATRGTRGAGRTPWRCHHPRPGLAIARRPGCDRRHHRRPCGKPAAVAPRRPGRGPWRDVARQPRPVDRDAVHCRQGARHAAQAGTGVAGNAGLRRAFLQPDRGGVHTRRRRIRRRHAHSASGHLPGMQRVGGIRPAVQAMVASQPDRPGDPDPRSGAAHLFAVRSHRPGPPDVRRRA